MTPAKFLIKCAGATRDQIYSKQDYKDYIEHRESEEKDKTTAASINALSSLGLTLGGIGLLAKHPEFGTPTAFGAMGLATGYHGARLFGWSRASQLIAGALLGITGAAVGGFVADSFKA